MQSYNLINANVITLNSKHQYAKNIIATDISKQQIKMLKSKTVWAAAAAVVGAVGGYFTGEVDLGAMLQIVVTSVLAAFLRHGVKKAEDAAS